MPDYRHEKQDSSDKVVPFDTKVSAEKNSPAKDTTNQLQGKLPPSLTATAARETAEKVSERLNQLPSDQQITLMKALYTGDLSSPDVQKILRSLRTQNISL